jgi:glutamate-1-semialdehyde 2,1-aminomutase
MEIAAQRLPGGVLGSARFRDDLGFVVKRGKGSKLWDVSGREYIDFLLGSGPMILGHAHPAVVAAVREQLEHGTTYFLVNEPVIKLADELCRAVPCAEQVRFTSTGLGGDVLRAPRGARLAQAREGDEVRGRLSRKPRLRADELIAASRPRRFRRRRRTLPASRTSSRVRC